MSTADFFPERGQDVRKALAVCEGCLVRAECLDNAMAQSPANDRGIWGGTTGRHRRAMRSPAA